MSKRSLPWLQFYPSDWLSDSIAGCSLAAQGLWFRMLFVAHNSQRYGYLEADGKAIPDEQLSRRCGCVSVEEYRNLLAELFSAGVPSRSPEGVIYSRRMVRDQQERVSAADRQRKHRSHAPVTPLSQGEVRSQRSEVISQKSETEVREKKPRAAKPATPADPRFQPFLVHCYESYRTLHRGDKPLWDGKDRKALQALLREHSAEALPNHRFTNAWEHYVQSTEQFTVDKNMSLYHFCRNIGQFADKPILKTIRGGKSNDPNEAFRGTVEGYLKNSRSGS